MQLFGDFAQLTGLFPLDHVYVLLVSVGMMYVQRGIIVK